jgi:ubiquitin carboxyl-terminal hydrolase 7
MSLTMHCVHPPLQAEQREKEKRQKEKQEAHLYCHVRIATDQDIAQQVGGGVMQDMVEPRDAK